MSSPPTCDPKDSRTIGRSDDRTQGLVFAIHRASLHDGPGLRTAIFLKGCPLRCQWCHNAESWDFAPTIRYQPSSCIGCSACVEACDQDCHTMVEGMHQYDRSACVACGDCTRECPTAALKQVGQLMTVDQVLAICERDRTAYAGSGGGMTLSGGEPLAQGDFAVALLNQARTRGIGTCVESSLHVSAAVVDAAADATDGWLCDVKAVDDGLHRQLTGVGVERIHRNLDRLLERGAVVDLRCPLIPGLNDADAELDRLADFIRARPRIASVELMPYHRLGAAKASECGVRVHDRPSADPQQIARWRTRLSLAGVVLR